MIDRQIRSFVRFAGPSSRARRCALAAAIALTAAGCADDLDTSYGGTTRRYLSTSVNGVDVLWGMFAEAGHEVTSRRILITSRMDEVQTVVWFPDDYAAPSEEVCEWFDDWLANDRRRTLVYVGRNFDAAIVYFRKIMTRVPAQQRATFDRMRRAIDQNERRAKSVAKAELKCHWFTMDHSLTKPETPTRGPWLLGIDPKRTELEEGTLIRPAVRSRTLLADDYSAFAWQRFNDDPDAGKLIVVENGSFLLNLPLVNHENRKLAGKLVDAVGPPGRLVFLESGTGGPPIDPPAEGSALAHLFGAWPLNIILLHLAVLGIIFCFARWPIFGRPRALAAETNSDFGKHVQAVGELFQRTRDRAYAISKLPENAEKPL